MVGKDVQSDSRRVGSHTMPTKTQQRTKPKSGPLSRVTGASRMDHRSAIMTRTVGVSERLGFPPRIRRTLKYCDSWYLLAPAGSTTYRAFVANGLYDFDATGTGHQPRSFDQYCSATGPYQVYRVLGVKIAITGTVATSSGATPPQQLPILLAAGFSTSGTNPTAPSGSVSSNIWGNTEIPGWAGTTLAVGMGPRTLTFDRSIASITGVPEQHIIGEDNYQGLYNSNPADQSCWFYVTYQSGDYTATTQGFTLTMSAEFDVQFENPLMQLAS